MQPDRRITSLVASEGSLWVGTRSGLWHYFPDVPCFLPVPGIDEAVLGMRQLDPDHLWFRTPSGRYILTLVDDKVLAAPDEVGALPLAAFGAGGAFWFLLEDRLYKRVGADMRAVELPVQGPFSAFHQRGETALWLGGDGFVCRLDLRDDSTRVYRTRIGAVHSLLELAGNLFVGMDSGVRRIDLGSLAFADNARLSNLPLTAQLVEFDRKPLAVADEALYLYAPERVEARAASFWVELPNRADRLGTPGFRALEVASSGLWTLDRDGLACFDTEARRWRALPLELASGRRVRGEQLCVGRDAVYVSDGDALFVIDPAEMLARQQAWPFLEVEPGGSFPGCLTRDAVRLDGGLYFLKGGVDPTRPGRVHRQRGAESVPDPAFGDEVWSIRADAVAVYFLGPYESCRVLRETGRRDWFGLRWPGGDADDWSIGAELSCGERRRCVFPLRAFTPDGRGGGYCLFGPAEIGHPDPLTVPGGLFHIDADGAARRLLFGDEHPSLREPSSLALRPEGELVVGGAGGALRISDRADGCGFAPLALPAGTSVARAHGADALLLLGPPLLWRDGEDAPWWTLDASESALALEDEQPAPAGLPPLLPLSLTPDGELVWIATARGLVRLDADREVRIFDGRNGFLTSRVYSVTRDADQLLVGTSHGIFSLRR